MARSSLARKPLPRPSPDSDPRYKRVMTQLGQGAAKTKVHPAASRKAADAAKAAKGPPNERAAAGKAKQVDKIKEAKEGKPEQSSFLAVLRAEIAKVMPKTLGETETFEQTAQQVKGGLKGNVSQQTASSTQDLSGASKAAPAPTGEAKAGQPLPKEGAPPTPRIDAAEGMPAPKSDADVSLQDSKQDLDVQIKAAEITPQQLEKGKSDPRYAAVQSARAAVARSADAGPAKYRTAEKGTLAASATAAASAARVGAAALLGVRGTSNVRVLTRQQQQKADDEKKRQEVVAKIGNIYTDTKKRVDDKLQALDGEVDGIFDRGVDAALNAMTKFVAARIRDYKFRRYRANPLLWVRDAILNLPKEVNQYTEQGRTLFHNLMDVLIVRVANLVEQRLREAKAEVAKGQAEIKTLVSSQPKELQQVARQAQADVTSRFAELEKGIEEKKDSLAQSLAQKYKDAFDKANDALKKQQEENKGLYDLAREKVEELANVLLEFKAKLAGIIRKGADTIKLIVDDPIGFLGNLISAVKGGFQAFVGNIKTHLEQRFLAWLFGNMPPGVAPPANLSLPSIFKLVMGVLGITYERMRAKAVKLIGARNVKIIETVADYIQTLVTGGTKALWEKVEGDLSDLKAMVIGAIQDYLIKTVIEKAVAKIVMMFNPAGAIVQAILTIYNVVMFVVEKAAQIAAFVESVVNSIHAIATGSIGAAVAKVEQSLARTIPIVIGFLASLASLGKLSAKVREFIMKVQGKVDAAIDKAIAKIVAFIKKKLGKLMGKGPTTPTPHRPTADDIDGLNSLAATSVPVLASGNPALAAQIARTPTGTKLVSQGGPAVDIARRIVQQHPNARFERSAKRLTLPPVSAGTVGGVGSVQALGAAIRNQTGAPTLVIKKQEKPRPARQVGIRLVRGGKAAGLPSDKIQTFSIEVVINPIANVLVGAFDENGLLVGDRYIPTFVGSGGQIGEITLTLTPQQWNRHILLRHVLQGLDKRDLSQRTVFLGSAAAYGALLEMAVNNQAVRNVVKPGATGMRDIALTMGSRSYKLKLNLNLGQIDSFHSIGPDDQRFARLPWQDAKGALHWEPRPRRR